MDKFYRVLEDNFLWKKGAILKKGKNGGYRPIEIELWDTTDVNGEEYISARIVEHKNNSKYFERVYKDGVSAKVFKTADKLIESYQKAFVK